MAKYHISISAFFLLLSSSYACAMQKDNELVLHDDNQIILDVQTSPPLITSLIMIASSDEIGKQNSFKLQKPEVDFLIHAYMTLSNHLEQGVIEKTDLISEKHDQIFERISNYFYWKANDKLQMYIAKNFPKIYGSSITEIIQSQNFPTKISTSLITNYTRNPENMNILSTLCINEYRQKTGDAKKEYGTALQQSHSYIFDNLSKQYKGFIYVNVDTDGPWLSSPHF